MSEATSPLPAVGQSLDLLMQQAICAIREAREAVERDIAQRGELTELVILSSRLAGFGDAIRQAALFAASGDALALAAVPDIEPRRGRHRHRVPRQRDDGRRPLLNVVRGLVPLAGLGAFRHALLPAAGTAAAATALTLGANSCMTLPYLSPAPPPHHALAALAPAAADVITLPSPSYQPRHAKASPDAVKATRVRLRLPAVTVSPAPSAPLPSPRPSAAPSGTLDVQTMQLSLGVTGHGQVTFFAVGGPVTWSASASSPFLALSQNSGTLQSGGVVILTVTTDPGIAGNSATITLTDGVGNAVQVPVAWTAGILLGP